MAAKIQKSSDLGKIWFPSRFCSCELISVIAFLELGALLWFFRSYHFLLFLFLLFHTFLSARFLGDALIKLYETL
jgi:uncharacterized membrane protein